MVDQDIINEHVEILAGRRRRSIDEAAVRLADLDGIMQMPSRLQSAKAAGSTPTAAEHDALVQDVQMLHQHLMAIMTAIQQRRIDARE